MSRVAIIALSSLLLVGLVGAVTFGFVTNWGKQDGNKLASSSKAVQAICNPTDYKDACFKSMAYVKSDDPKELVKAAFASAKAELTDVASKSTTVRELEKDPKTAQAIKDCKELFQDAIDDFQRSFDKIGKFEFDQINDILSDLKTWLSATRTYQETCLDGFENTTGNASEKMRKVLQTAIQMSSNGLAIVNDLSSLFTNLDISSTFNRKLLSHRTMNRHLLGNNDEDPNIDLQDSEEDRRRRRLLHSAPVVGHAHSDLFLPEWIDGFRRKLLEATDLADDDLKTKANVVVAQDGSGKYKTIEEALKDIPRYGNETFIVYIKEGTYNEYLVLQKWMTHVVFVGDGPTKTKITNNQNFVDGTKTFKTATLSALGDFFMAKDIGVENSAGAIKHQAVALRVQSDKAIFYNCQFDGYQDTLYAHTYRQFYRDCKITGTIDFIFGDATAFFQNCTLVVRKPLENQACIVTAQGRMERHQPTGIYMHKCKFEADPDYYPVKDKNKAYLGRPWKEYSKTIIMESEIGDLIQPEGWLPWEGNFGLDTSYYGEYNNVGAGASLAHRVRWRGVKTIIRSRAEKFMPPVLFEKDDWIKESGIPYEPNLTGAAEGPSMSGVDEDPNAPAGAPSSLDDSSSSGGDISSSTSSSGSSSSKSSSSSSSSGSSSSSSGSSAKKASHGSSDSSSKGSSSSSGGGTSSSGGTSYGGGTSSSGGTSSGGDTSSSSGSSDSSSKGSSSSSSGKDTSSSGGTTSDSSSSNASPTTSDKGSSEGPLTIADAPSAAPAPSPSFSLEADLATPTPTPTPTTISPIDVPSTTTQNTPATPPTSSSSTTSTSSLSPTKSTSSSSSSSSPSSSSTTLGVKASAHVGPVTMRELERMLMDNEEVVGEDESVNDDMSGNIPDGDEPSPARVSPTPAPSTISVSPSLSPSSTNGPSLGPSSDEEVSDWMPPATAPEPSTDEEADKVPATVSPPPKSNSGSRSKFELHMILSGIVMWAALFM